MSCVHGVCILNHELCFSQACCGDQASSCHAQHDPWCSLCPTKQAAAGQYKLLVVYEIKLELCSPPPPPCTPPFKDMEEATSRGSLTAAMCENWENHRGTVTVLEFTVIIVKCGELNRSICLASFPGPTHKRNKPNKLARSTFLNMLAILSAKAHL